MRLIPRGASPPALPAEPAGFPPPVASLRSSILCVAFLIAGCGGRQQAAEGLSESIRSFNEGIRWERFSVAAARVPAVERSRFVEDMDQRAEDLKITDYEIVQVDNRGSKEARVHVKLSWYRTSEGTLRETHALQTWERQGKAWMMVAEARMRGAEMPGLSDREPSTP
jgi:hypothetical protein